MRRCSRSSRRRARQRVPVRADARPRRPARRPGGADRELQGRRPADDELLITSGGIEALELVCKSFLDRGDLVAVEGPTYLGAIMAFRGFEADVVAVPMDENGLQVDELERRLADGLRPKLLYTIPDHQNPAGVSLSAERRALLVELARRHGFLIVEDVAYRELGFDGNAPPSLWSLAPDVVVQAGTTSKTFFPGVRLGWASAPGDLRAARRGEAEHRSVRGRARTAALRGVRASRLDRRAARAVARAVPAQVRAHARRARALMPAGAQLDDAAGRVLLVADAAGCDAADLARRAVGPGVGIVPGSLFFPDGRGGDNVRLSFSMVDEAQIDDGHRAARVAAVAALRRWLRRIGIALLVIVVALTIASFAYNAATNGREQPASSLYPGPFVSVDGTRVAYRSWGSTGSPIILVGGFVEPSWVWNRVGPLLGRAHRVIALDLPPFGYTLRRGPYTLARWVDLVQAVSAKLRLVRPVVVGHSLGAAVAVDVALTHRADVSGIVLLDGDALPVGGPHWLAQLVLDPYYTSIFRVVTGSDWVVGRALRGALGPHAPKQTHAELEPWERQFRVDGTAAAFKQLFETGVQGVSLADRAGARAARRRVGRARLGRLGRRGSEVRSCAPCQVRARSGSGASLDARRAADGGEADRATSTNSVTVLTADHGSRRYETLRAGRRPQPRGQHLGGRWLSEARSPDFVASGWGIPSGQTRR